MRRFLLDTNALNAFVNHRGGVPERAHEARLRGDRIGTCEPVVAELFYGLELSSSRDENTVRLERALSRIYSWPFDRPAAKEYGRIAAHLRRSGRPMQVVDMQIASIAISLGSCTVVSSDTDLLDVPGLTVENWGG